MSPTVLYLTISMVEEAIKDTPGIIADLKEIFSKADPTPADWENLRVKVLSKSYADYVPASALPPASPAAGIPVPVAAPAESNAPINEPGASAEAESQAQEQKQPDPAPVATAQAAADSPYLADGTKNPAFNHL